MQDKIKRGLEKLSLLPEFIDATIQQMNKHLPANERQIVFTLDDIRLYTDWDGSGRHAFLLLNAFNEAGYNVYLYRKVGFLSYTRLARYGRYLYDLSNVKVIPSLPAKTENIIYAFDTVYPEALDRPWKKRTFVNILKDPSVRLGSVVPIPFSMHPIWYRGDAYKKALALRNSRRTLRVLFGGNTTTEFYSSPNFINYKQVTRADGLKAAYSTGKIRPFADKGEIDAIFNSSGYLHEGRVLKTDDKTVGVENRWLELVAKSDFFLCLSGTDLPMCHNAIESMAVGAIPIIGYPHWFFPPLEHMKNAVIYSDQDDLVRKINEVLNMSNDQIKRLREGVLKYYDEHLGGVNFVRKYEEQKDHENTVMLYPYFIPPQWEQAKSQKTLEALRNYFGNKVEAAS